MIKELTVMAALVVPAEWSYDYFDLDKGLVLNHNSVSIDAPYRALNSSNVPIVIESTNPDIVSFNLVIDKNPTPCCAKFFFYDIPAKVSTNIRVNAYTDLTVNAKDSKGKSHIATDYVKGSGGCSAPSRWSETIGPKGRITVDRALSWITTTIYHPNHTGLQYNSLTGSEVPADYIERVEIFINKKKVFYYEGVIGIAENVYFSLPIQSFGKSITVNAYDNSGKVYTLND